MTITIKTGVPGSGKTQSMVSELLAMANKAKSSEGTFRPIYTNIDGLNQDLIPHHRLANMPASSEPFVRQEGVLYTVDWVKLPPESIVVIDEAQDHGYDAMATQAKVPEHVRLLAQHRKDYSVDIWFISQHPKQLHSRLRVLCARHQHYERKFGMKSAFCYEWSAAHDNLEGKKTAVISRFAFQKSAQAAYASSQVHTKVKYKLPLWVWLPVLLIPFGLYVLPQTAGVVSSVMSGKGVSQDKHVTGPQSAASAPKPVVVASVAVSAPALVSSVAGSVNMLSATKTAIVDLKRDVVGGGYGCVSSGPRCSCYDVKTGLSVDTDKAMCVALNVRPVFNVGPDTIRPVDLALATGDNDVLHWMAANRSLHAKQ